VYIDDGTVGDSGEMKIDIDGHEYVEQENYAYDGTGGVVDSVAVDTADGGHLVYSDSDHDGTADLVTQYDAHDDEVQQAHYDTAGGQWIDDTPHVTTTAAAVHADGITVDTASGAHDVGPATVDTNNDGRPDTAVVHAANGDTVLYTDSHGDGRADVATEFTPDGQVVIADETGHGQWTEVEHGHLAADGSYQRDSTATGEFTPPVGQDDTADDKHWAGSDDGGWAAAFSDSGSSQGVVRIDATTGQWISRN
jgi:hypothetical protein